MDLNENNPDTSATQHRDTQTRMKIDVNAKAGDVKGKLQLWNDFETWNGFEAQDGSSTTAVAAPGTGTYSRNTIGIREAWVSFPLPGTPVAVTAGHQLLTIGNGWFFRSMHFGSDAWVVSSKLGDANLAFVNVKFGENDAQESDDVDAYALIGAFKVGDMNIGADFTNLQNDTNRAARTNLYNIGVNVNGKVGPVGLKAQVDFQMGEVDNATGDDPSFKGNQFVIQGNVPVGPAAINFTLAQGSGEDSGTDIKQYQNALDIDPHYTFLYEYKMNQAGGTTKNFGFSNTTAVGVGATFAATKSLTIGADFWMLQATEKGTLPDDEVGQEIDVKVNWKVADNLNWNWVLGMFMPGDAYGTADDDATGIQGILSFAF
jgi:hypothetical protein